MKNSRLTTTDFAPRPGGVARYYSEIAKRLDQDRTSVLFIDQTHSVGSRHAWTLPVYRKKWLPLIPRWIQATMRTWLAARKTGAETIWVGDILPFGTAAYILLKLRLIPEYIVSVHGLDVLTAYKNKPKLAAKILGQARAITTNSEFVRAQVVKQGIDQKKIHIVYPGVSPAVGAGLAPAQNVRADGHPPVLMTVARLEHRKGIDDVIRALPKVWERYHDLEYHIVGDGPVRQELETLSVDVGALLIAPVRERVVFHGKVSDSQLEKLYHQASVFVMTPKADPVDIEGFGIVYLEAGAYSLPVVASKTGGVPEAVEHGENGLLVTPDNSDEIAESILKILDSEETHNTLASHGLERVQ